MEKIIKRVEEEKKELDKKLMDLHVYINGEQFISLGVDYKNMLDQQYEAMDSYSCILRNRLVQFRKDMK